MKLRVLDVPERFATTLVEDIPGGVAHPVPNGGPEVEVSAFSGPVQAHQELVRLALVDGWAGLYDLSNPDTVTVDDEGRIVQVDDSLGFLPPLRAQVQGQQVAGAAPVQVGALAGYQGGLTLEVSEPTDLSVTCALIPQPFVPPWTYSGSDGTGGVAYPASSGDWSDTRESQSGSSTEVFMGAVTMGQPTVMTLGTNPGVWVGHHRLQPDSGGDDPVQVPGAETFFIGLSPVAGIAVSRGHMAPEAHARMVDALTRLAGAPATMKEDSQGFVPTGYASLDDQGQLVAGFRADRPEQLASVTKVLTCFLARQLVPDTELDGLITVVPQYVPETTTRTPVLTVGDKISWRDAFHGALMVSHNHLSDTIAHHAGLRLVPGSTTPIDDFVAHMNTVAKTLWGWEEAVFTTPQGRYDNRLTPRHVCELLHKVAAQDPWLTQAMGAVTHQYTVHWADPDREDDTAVWTNIVRDGHTGVPYPELVAGKSGDTPTPTKRTVAVLWKNPATGRYTASCALDTGSTSGHRWALLRRLMDTTRGYYQSPLGWQPRIDGTILNWGHDGETNFVAVTAEPGEVTKPSASPFSIFRDPLPIVQAGDHVKVEAYFRGANPGDTSRLKLEARLIGGRWDTGSHTIHRTDLYSPTHAWVRRTLSGTVTRRATFDLIITDESDTSQGFHVRDVKVTVTSPGGKVYAYELEVMDYMIRQDAQPIDSSDTAGSVGEISATVQAPQDWPITSMYGVEWLNGKQIQLVDSNAVVAGQITAVQNVDNTALSLDATTALGPLNAFNVHSRPYDGSLIGLIQEYMSLAVGYIPALTADQKLQGRKITVPGWTGELWHHIKMLCAAERIQLTVSDTGIHVSPAAETWVEPAPAESLTEANPASLRAQYVEVIHRNNRAVKDLIVYPHGGWDEEVGILSVNAGEYVVHTLQLQTSLESFIQPEQVEYVSRLDRSRSQYTITGDDGATVTRREFYEAGGRIDFRLGADRRTIEVIMQGPRGLVNTDRKYIRTFSMASRFGDAEYRYSTLRILGTGVMWDETPVRFPTGLTPSKTGTLVGAVIDNPFLSTMTQVVRAGTEAARKYAGYNPSVTVTTPVRELAQVGAVMPSRILDYRVTSVESGPALVKVTGEYHLTHHTHQLGREGTYKQAANAANALLGEATYRDEQMRGKNR